MMTMRWQHWVNFIAGGWLFASPWVLDYLSKPFTAAFNALIVGAAILGCSLLALQFEEIEKIARSTLIAWTLLAPWVLKFTDPALLAANTIGVGFLVLLMSAWMLAEESSLIHWRRKGIWTRAAQK
jgi:hypothetical protein